MNGETIMKGISEIADSYILEAYEYKPAESKKKGLSSSFFKKAAAIAASILIILFIPLTVYAAVNKISITDAVVKIYNEYIIVHFENREESANKYHLLETELAKELKENVVYPVLLPEALLGKDSKITNISYEFDSSVNKAEISFEYRNQKGYMAICCHSSPDFIEQSQYESATNVTVIETNGVCIYVFEQGEKSMIVFRDGLTEYTVILETPIEQTIAFANTIK